MQLNIYNGNKSVKPKKAQGTQPKTGSERALQAQIISLIRKKYKSKLIPFVVDLNGWVNIKNYRTRQILYEIGRETSIDLILLCPSADNKFNFLGMEFKDSCPFYKNRPLKLKKNFIDEQGAQAFFMSKMINQGGFACYVWDFNQGEKLLNYWIENNEELSYSKVFYNYSWHDNLPLIRLF